MIRTAVRNARLFAPFAERVERAVRIQRFRCWARAEKRSYGGKMFVVLLHYTAPESEIDMRLVDHYEWISRHYDAGDFIAAGQQHPREGAVIIARAMPRLRLDAILATDPFVLHRLARYEVIEFRALRTIPELAKYADPLTVPS